MLERLFLNLLQVSLITAAVILPLALLRAALKKRYPAAVMCFVWALLAVRLLVPVQLAPKEAPVTVRPATSHVVYRPGSSEHYAITEGFAQSAGVQTWVTGDQAIARETDAAVQYVMPWGLIAAGIVCLVALALLLFRLGAYARFRRRALLLGSAAEEATQEILRQECAACGIRRSISLIVTPLVDGPMLAGLWRPVLLLPEEPFSGCELRFVFRHELTHYLRHDLLLKLLLTLAKTLHWFNPFVYLMACKAGEDIELACDSAAVRDMTAAERQGYGMTILRCAAAQSGARQSLTTCFTSGKESLRARLAGLFDETVKKRGTALLLAVLLTVGVLGGSFAIRQDAGAQPLTAQQDMEALAAQWAQAYVGCDGEAMYDLLATEPAATFYQSRLDALAEMGLTDTYPGGQLWQLGEPWLGGYVVQSVDAARREAVVVYNWGFADGHQMNEWRSARNWNEETRSPITRSVETLHFIWENGVCRISRAEGNVFTEPENTDDGQSRSAEEFRLRFANDLGLPDFKSYYLQINAGSESFDIRDAEQTAVHLFGLAGGTAETTLTNGEDIIRKEADVRYRFADRSEITIKLLPFSDGVWLPVDWYGPEQADMRTVTDLASQWARGLLYRDGQYRYAIMGDDERERFAASAKRLGEGYWTWEIGTPSPWVERFTVIPDGETARIIYAARDVTPRESRHVDTLTFAVLADGRRVVTEYKIATPALDSVRAFEMLYDNALGLPLYSFEDVMAFEVGGGYTEAESAVQRYFALQNARLMGSSTLETPDGTVWAQTLTYDFAGSRDTLTLQLTPVQDGSTQVTTWLPTGWKTSNGKQGGVLAPSFGARMDTSYKNERTGILVKLPANWAGRYTAEDTGTEIIFRQAQPGNAEGMLLTLCTAAESEMQQNYGATTAEMEANFPQPMRVIGARAGQLYYLVYPSDVQFDLENSVAWGEYAAMSRTGRALTADAFKLFASDDGAEAELTTLAAQWAQAFQERSGRTLYSLMSRPAQQRFYDHQLATFPDRAPGETEFTEEWLYGMGISSPWPDQYTVQSIDMETLRATIVYSWRLTGEHPMRSEEQITFVEEDGVFRIDQSEKAGIFSGEWTEDLGNVDSLARFLTLYANDLGLPSPNTMRLDDEPLHEKELLDPARSAVLWFDLTSGSVTRTQEYDAEGVPAGKIVTYRFQTGEELHIVMMNWKQGYYIPRDWYLADGTNARTSTDIANQWACGWFQEDGQYRYPILNDALKAAFPQQQLDSGIAFTEDGSWSWRLGMGSSPNTSGWTLMPQEDGSIRIVYTMYDSGNPFYRYSETVRIGVEHGRTVIVGVGDARECFGSEIATVEDFRYFYDNTLKPPYDGDWLAYRGERGSDTYYEWLEDPIKVVKTFYQLADSVDCTAGPIAENGEVTVCAVFGQSEEALYVTLARSDERYPTVWLPQNWRLEPRSDVFFPFAGSGVPRVLTMGFIDAQGKAITRENAGLWPLSAGSSISLDYEGTDVRLTVVYNDQSADRRVLLERALPDVADATKIDALKIALPTLPAGSGALTVRLSAGERGADEMTAYVNYAV